MSTAAVKPLLLLTHKMLGHTMVVLAGLGVATTIDFSHEVTLGSVLIAVVIVGIAGVFTVRSKIASIWREEAEGERAAKDRLQETLDQERADRLSFEQQQQELRHSLKNEIAALGSQLKVMEARTDLTEALASIRQMNADLAESVSSAIVATMEHSAEHSMQRDKETHRLLGEIRDKLRSEPIDVREVEAHRG